MGGNLTRLRRDYKEVQELYSVGGALFPYFPLPGLKDRVGMGPTIAMLQASTHAGRHCEKVQHASAWRTRTVFNHVWNASSNYIGTAKPGVAQSKGEFVSGSPTYEDWWFRFNKVTRG